MRIIKIKRNTIRKNPNYGLVHTVTGKKDIYFQSSNPIPKDLMKYVIITSSYSTTNNTYFCKGIIKDIDTIEKFKKLKGFQYEIKINHYHIKSMEEEYLYEYEPISLKCKCCHSIIKAEVIDSEYDDNGSKVTVCPECNEYNTFEDFKFEDISDALK